MNIYQVWMIRNEYGQQPRPCGSPMNIFAAQDLLKHLQATNPQRQFEIRTLA